MATPKFNVGDWVRPSRPGGAGKVFRVDGFVENAYGKLYVAISYLGGRGAGCIPYRAVRKLTAREIATYTTHGWIAASHEMKPKAQGEATNNETNAPHP